MTSLTMTSLTMNVMQSCVAVQVATIEVANEDVHEHKAMPALDECYKQLGKDIKDIKKALGVYK